MGLPSFNVPVLISGPCMCIVGRHRVILAICVCVFVCVLCAFVCISLLKVSLYQMDRQHDKKHNKKMKMKPWFEDVARAPVQNGPVTLRGPLVALT